MQKKRNSTHLIPYNYGHKFKDGSLSTDIPTLALNTQFNVNYTIVSQVNPHVHVFFYANQGSPGRPVTHLEGRGWRGGFLASTIEQMLKLDMAKWLKVLRSLKLLPNVNDQDWSSVFLQKFDGNVTILVSLPVETLSEWIYSHLCYPSQPKSDLSDWLYTIADPDTERLKKLMSIGQIRTWPKISMISNRMRIEASIEKMRGLLRANANNKNNRAGRFNSHSDVETEKLSQSIEAHDAMNHANNSDAGSGDELVFLSRRRVSMPDGSFQHLQDKDFFKEQNRRRKFMAQFLDSPKEGNNSTQSSVLFDSHSDDSDAHSPPPSSPEDYSQQHH